MDAIFLQVLNGLDKGGAYALIALGLTLVFGTLGVVNFAHGALFMLGAFCAVSLQRMLSVSYERISDTKTDFLGNPLKEQVSYMVDWVGPDAAAFLQDYSVPLSIILAAIFMAIFGIVMERGLIKHFYKRPHADQILVTFGLAIVIQELVRHYFGANPIPQSAPDIVSGAANVGSWVGLGDNVIYPWWRLVYFVFSAVVIFGVFAFLQFTTFGMVVRAGMQDRETVVEYKGKQGGSFGHGYYRKNPAVSSDIILTIRYGKDPGANNGRPLEHMGNIFWQIDDNYLKAAKP